MTWWPYWPCWNRDFPMPDSRAGYGVRALPSFVRDHELSVARGVDLLALAVLMRDACSLLVDAAHQLHPKIGAVAEVELVWSSVCGSARFA